MESIASQLSVADEAELIVHVKHNVISTPPFALDESVCNQNPCSIQACQLVNLFNYHALCWSPLAVQCRNRPQAMNQSTLLLPAAQNSCSNGLVGWCLGRELMVVNLPTCQSDCANDFPATDFPSDNALYEFLHVGQGM